MTAAEMEALAARFASVCEATASQKTEMALPGGGTIRILAVEACPSDTAYIVGDHSVASVRFKRERAA